MDHIQAHPDIELGVARTPLAYIACLPDAGIDAETGLILYIGGYGMDARDGYTASLLPYLANKHNCVAATLEYFGAKLISPQSIETLTPHPDFFTKLNEHYGLAITASKDIGIAQIINGVTGLLAQNGMTHLHEECALFINSPEYNSMGFLPALDGLQTVHTLLNRFPLDKKRLFLLGTSYGGYVAGFMAKLAPRTFRMIVDNSGFSSAADDMPGVLGWQKLFVNGVSMLCQNVRHWSLDPREPNFLSDGRKAIRDLAHADHATANTARIYAYHAANDTVALTERKLGLRDFYRSHTAYELTIIDQDQIDGRLFKNLSHGMNASLRGLFDLSYDKFIRDGGALSDETDFDRRSRYVFPCGREDYGVTFSPAQGITVEIAPARTRRSQPPGVAA